MFLHILEFKWLKSLETFSFRAFLFNRNQPLYRPIQSHQTPSTKTGVLSCRAMGDAGLPQCQWVSLCYRMTLVTRYCIMLQTNPLKHLPSWGSRKRLRHWPTKTWSKVSGAFKGQFQFIFHFFLVHMLQLGFRQKHHLLSLRKHHVLALNTCFLLPQTCLEADSISSAFKLFNW